jgi:hypothetical protein
MSYNRRVDDGTEQWLTEVTRQRIAQQAHVKFNRGNQQGKSYLDQKVNTRTQQQQEVLITDPFIKTIVENRHKQPVYGPAHLGGKAVDNTTAANYEVEVDMGAMERSILQRNMQFQRETGVQATSVDDFGMNRLFSSNNQLPGIHQAPQQNTFQSQQPYQQTVTLKEGFPVYRAIQAASSECTVTLAREIGVSNAGLAAQPYILRSPLSVYVIPAHQTAVNLQEIQRNPQLLVSLVQIQAPPMSSLGTLLVQQEAVSGAGNFQQATQNRQIITDARQYNQQFQQPQYQQPTYAPQVQQVTKQYGVPIRRGILRG